jgi:hypothetical protein
MEENHATISKELERRFFQRLMAPTPGIEPGPTGWQFKTIPRRHSNIYVKRPELKLFIIQTDFTSSMKKKNLSLQPIKKKVMPIISTT